MLAETIIRVLPPRSNSPVGQMEKMVMEITTGTEQTHRDGGIHPWEMNGIIIAMAREILAISLGMKMARIQAGRWTITIPITTTAIPVRGVPRRCQVTLAVLGKIKGRRMGTLTMEDSGVTMRREMVLLRLRRTIM
jgi:hypothetical protein